MKLDAVDERVLSDRPGVCGTPPQRLAVGLAGSPDVPPGDRRERYKLNRVDLDLPEADWISTALFDLQPLPQSDRERDVTGQNVAAQLAAELHTRDASVSALSQDQACFGAGPGGGACSRTVRPWFPPAT